jgi:hypothetical protein
MAMRVEVADVIKRKHPIQSTALTLLMNEPFLGRRQRDIGSNMREVNALPNISRVNECRKELTMAA